MFEKLKAWLNSRGDYTTGVNLYRSLGNDINTLNYFTVSGKTSASYDRLFAELRTIFYSIKNGTPLPAVKPAVGISPSTVSTTAPAAAAIPASAAVPPSVTSVSPINAELEQSQKAQANKVYKDLMNERARLFYSCSIEPQRYENNDEVLNIRKQMVLRILELQPEVHNQFATLRHIQQHGTMPEVGSKKNEEEVIPTDPILLERFRVNLLKRISRNKNLVESPERIAYRQYLLQLKEKVYNAIDQAAAKK